MTPRARVMLLSALLAAGTAGCGQQGPLVLREDARAIERVQPPATDAETEPSDGERRDER